MRRRSNRESGIDPVAVLQWRHFSAGRQELIVRASEEERVEMMMRERKMHPRKDPDRAREIQHLLAVPVFRGRRETGEEEEDDDDGQAEIIAFILLSRTVEQAPQQPAHWQLSCCARPPCSSPPPVPRAPPLGEG